MKFQVMAEDRETGARKVVMLEAESKAAVEKKARGMGLNVRSIRDVSEGMPDTTPTVHRAQRGGGLVRAIIVLLILAILAIVVWRYVLPMFAGGA